MKLILGLGNYGPEYQNSRHNLGFMVLDAMAEKQHLIWQHKPRFRAHVAELTYDTQKVILAKPTTYYNLIGLPARAICDFYKIRPQDVLVVHDELALPLGTLRTRRGGSDAGNRGIMSLIEHLGPAFARLRLGIANDQLATIAAADFVLASFRKVELPKLRSMVSLGLIFIDDFISDNFSETTNKNEE